MVLIQVPTKPMVAITATTRMPRSTVYSIRAAPSSSLEKRLIRAFVKRALRRPVEEADVQPIIKLAHKALDSGVTFTDTMITAYSAVLCSPAFVTLEANGTERVVSSLVV